jgi:hypothetical protein
MNLEIAVLPRVAVGGGFVAAIDDLACEIRRLLDGLADHEGRELHLMLVHQVEDVRHALIDAVLEEGVCRQVGQTLLDRIGDDAASAGDRLAAGLEHEREADGEAGVVGPEGFRGGHGDLLRAGGKGQGRGHDKIGATAYAQLDET